MCRGYLNLLCGGSTRLRFGLLWSRLRRRGLGFGLAEGGCRPLRCLGGCHFVRPWLEDTRVLMQEPRAGLGREWCSLHQLLCKGIRFGEERQKNIGYLRTLCMESNAELLHKKKWSSLAPVSSRWPCFLGRSSPSLTLAALSDATPVLELSALCPFSPHHNIVQYKKNEPIMVKFNPSKKREISQSRKSTSWRELNSTELQQAHMKKNQNRTTTETQREEPDESREGANSIPIISIIAVNKDTHQQT
ncbi:hypothetical protein HPP92_004479 [Vanilla planifolia]|uniref:Uncharacterized protein n=1 Tax=Vanilla planifolia TaxID=51239 RepID=A0A835RSB0_VANPL|nr:hypothetical protein HPP92_004479 [Vanilla planifolia]